MKGTSTAKSAPLGAVVGFLDDTLAPARFGSDPALNGLQVEASVSIRRVSLAVDACADSIRRAARAGADLLIAHHGLFWDVRQPVKGLLAERLALLFEHRVSLYAAHLPLDCHPTLGNNAQLARLLGIGETEPFGEYRGVLIGASGSLPRPVNARRLASLLGRKLGSTVRSFPFGPPTVRRLGIVSGGGASLAHAAAAAGCHALLTGETSHAAYHDARESKIHLLCAGHYATEAPGIRALGEFLRAEIGLPAHFIDCPTGL